MNQIVWVYSDSVGTRKERAFVRPGRHVGVPTPLELRRHVGVPTPLYLRRHVGVPTPLELILNTP
jgi:hypothetical protein